MTSGCDPAVPIVTSMIGDVTRFVNAVTRVTKPAPGVRSTPNSAPFSRSAFSSEFASVTVPRLENRGWYISYMLGARNDSYTLPRDAIHSDCCQRKPNEPVMLLVER